MDKNLLGVARVASLITGILWCIFFAPIGVFNLIASHKFNEAKNGSVSRATVRNWGIYLIFTDVFSAIFALVASTSVDDSTSHRSQSPIKTYSAEERLSNLKSLYESGSISRDEYDNRRREIIESI